MNAVLPHCQIIVPAYNEEEAIADCIERLEAVINQITTHRVDILVVNDGSSDRTPEILKNYPQVQVIHHPRNRGYGAALHTGIGQSTAEWIALVDSDGTYPLEELKRLLAETADNYDMVVGARQGIGITINPAKRLARWILRRIVWMLTGVMVKDLNSGMRVFRRELFTQFQNILPLGFSFTSTITVASLYSGYHVCYRDIQYDKRKGRSSIRPVYDFFGFVMLIVRLVTFFDPLRFFLPLSFIIFISGILRGVRDVYYFNRTGGVAVIVMMAALQVFLTGILADLIVRRTSIGKAPTASMKDRKRLVHVGKSES